MKYPPYPKYKPSGIEWLGDVPAHWDVSRIGFLTNKVGSGKTPKGGAEVYQSDGVMLIRSQNVYDDGLRLEDVVFIDDETNWEMIGTRVKPRDVLLNITGASLGRCTIVPADFPSANVNQHVCIVRADTRKTEPAFLQSCLTSQFVKHQIFAGEEGSSREGLNFQQVRNLIVVLPPLAEQRAIAGFLDAETGRLDRLVAKKRELIERLKEKRAALISRTVTRGLPPAAARAAGLPENPPLKPTNIDWLGNIPAHWDVNRLRFVSPHLTVGIVIEPSKYYVDDGIPALRSLNVKPHRLSENDLVFISPESNELHAKSKIFEGDLVAVRSGQPGTTAIVDKRFNGTNCIDLIIIRKPHKTSPSFLCYFLNSDLANTQFETGTGGAIQQHFNISTAASLQIVVPPLSEQAAIVAYLDAETAKLDALTAKVEAAIERLQEYRTALITAAVTGKIDVREVAGGHGMKPTRAAMA